MSTEENQNLEWILVDRRMELYELKYLDHIYIIQLENPLSRFSKNKKYMTVRTTTFNRKIGGTYLGLFNSIDDAKLEVQKDIMELKDGIDETP